MTNRPNSEFLPSMRILPLLAITSVCANATAHANVRLPVLFSDNMVLQRGKADPVWGTASPGEAITATIAAQRKTAHTGADGKWSLRLDPMDATTGLTLTVAGTNTIALQNVAVGDVYICSGQSNMEFGVVGAINGAQEVATANFPDIRLFWVPRSVQPRPLTDLAAPSSWQPCSPANVGGFSAVGYFFGRELHQHLKVPIGLIDSSWGGTVAQAWTSRDTLINMADFKDEVHTVDAASTTTGTIEQRLAAWWQANDPGSVNNSWAATAYDSSTWKEIILPHPWQQAGLAGFRGVVWFRNSLEMPEGWVGKDLTLHLGHIADEDATYFNGSLIGATVGVKNLRDYKVPANLVKAGTNVIAVRVLGVESDAGIFGGNGTNMRLAGPDGDPLPLEPDTGDDPLTLDGVWKYRAGRGMAQFTPRPVDFSGNPNVSTVLYNGMIAPLEPFGLKGAIWYQGESNAGNPMQYRTLFPALIRDWRQHFGQGDFGFYFVQLANYMARDTAPTESNWAELREAQTMTLALPHTGMATIIDVGEAGDIHPKDKQDVGRRLALAALVDGYGEKSEYSGPVFAGMQKEGQTLRVNFSHAAGLKTNDGKPPVGFAIAGDDKKYSWADARIEGASIVLSSDAVKSPSAVRYAWGNNPAVNLYNKAELPAVPFRTDSPETITNK